MFYSRPQKPLRRIDIGEVGGQVPQGGSGPRAPLLQEVVREVEEGSSPLSTSPSAKMIRIEEPSEVPSSDRSVLQSCSEGSRFITSLSRIKQLFFSSDKPKNQNRQKASVHQPNPPPQIRRLRPPAASSWRPTSAGSGTSPKPFTDI